MTEMFRRHYSLLPPVIKILLFSNVIIFLFEQSFADELITYFALWPVVPDELALQNPNTIEFMPWQIISYAFLHGSPMHLILNMYALWLFGSRMENYWGSKAFGFYYFVCVVGAGLVQLWVVSMGAVNGEVYPTVGASGGVYGLLLAFGMTFPYERLVLIFPPVVLQARWFVLIFGAIELWAGVSGSLAGVAHFAHLGGMAFGFFLIHYWRRHPPRFD